MQRQRGLTLLELLVVLAIIGITIAGVSLSLRSSPQAQLAREAQRLVAVLEAARAQSRSSGVALVWQANAEGFTLQPVTPPAQTPGAPAPRTEPWLTAGTQATIASSTNDTVVLGPEPILAPTRITLSVTGTNNPTGESSTQSVAVIRIGTNGLAPFRVEP
ncbi:MAG: prepilin-type N-terminal cleavage/methylation domain-containing protein [Limnohabitans sp.]